MQQNLHQCRQTSVKLTTPHPIQVHLLRAVAEAQAPSPPPSPSPVQPAQKASKPYESAMSGQACWQPAPADVMSSVCAAVASTAAGQHPSRGHVALCPLGQSTPPHHLTSWVKQQHAHAPHPPDSKCVEALNLQPEQHLD
jgi:hypothetical protein